MESTEKISAILVHISNVRRNCTKLGFALIDAGEEEQGRHLIANGLIHDNSKFSGIEFEYLYSGNNDNELLQKAIKQHTSQNKHHPEYWESIHKMPDVYLAEMVCDLAARSSEFGNDVYDYITNIATKKFNFNMQDTVGIKMTTYLETLLNKPFK